MRMMYRIVCLVLLAIFAITGCQKPPTPASIEIHDIQGCGHTSPLVGRTVADVQGIVTLKLDNGFVMQSSTPDDKSCSSEAIFVHTNGYSSVLTGDLVSVSGKVSEFTPGNIEEKNLSQTEITDAHIKVVSSGNAFPNATLIGSGGYKLPNKVIEDDQMNIFDPENDGLDYFESLEWMRLKLPKLAVVGPRNSFDEIVVTEETMEGVLREDFAAVASIGSLRPDRIMLELPGDWTRNVNMGDQIEEGIIGILLYSYGNYKVHPVTKISLVKFTNMASQEIVDFSGLRIASYNIHNFSQFSDKSKIEHLGDQIANDLRSPDLLILQEVLDDSGTSDDGTTSAKENLEALINAINGAGGDKYQYFDFPPENNQSGGVEGGNIRTVFLLKTSSLLKLSSASGRFEENMNVQPLGEGEVTFSPNPGIYGVDQQGFENSRKPIAGLFEYQGRQIIVVGLHLVSRGMDSPLYGSDQPISQPELNKRMDEAIAVNTWLATIQEQAPQALIIVAGDMNDGFQGEAARALQGDILEDTAKMMEAKSRFSIIYDGLAMLFDHILVSKNALVDQIQVLHLNSVLDENSQVSDHDPIVVTLTVK